MKRLLSDPRTLFIATYIILLLPNAGLSLTEPMTASERAANVLLPAGVYLLLLSCFRQPAKGFWWVFLLVFLSAFQMVLLYLFGDSIIAVDMFLNLVTTNPSEVEELLGSLLPAIIGVVVIYVPVIALAIVRTGRHSYILTDTFMRKTRVAGAAVAAIGAVMVGVCRVAPTSQRATPYSVLDKLYPVNVGYNVYLAVERTRLTAAREQNVAEFRFEATHVPDSLREVYVMVIGETARAENFGILGYNRPTTPRMSAADGVVAFREAYTQSNTTHKSVPMLLSAASAVDFDRLYAQKGVLAAFGEAGFHTAFISNQRPNHSFIDFLGGEADVCRFLKEESDEDANVPDCALVDVLARLIKETQGNLFVVLHTYGSHFRYNERYPESMRRWTPDGPDDAVASNREALINAYDNTILYTDRLLGDIIDTLAATGVSAAMLYASDHGENIFDDGKGLFLHASPRPSAHELHVPMIAWTSQRHRELRPDVSEALEANSSRRVLTSASLFHTMLHLGGVETAIFADSLSAASPRMADIPYLYLTDRNVPVPVEEIMR